MFQNQLLSKPFTMEEDVEIEVLLKSNEEMLMLEASMLKEDENNEEKVSEGDVSMQYNISIVEDSIKTLDQEHSSCNQLENHEEAVLTQESCTLTNTVNNNDEVDYNDEVQELLDDHIVSYMAKTPTKDSLHFYSDEESDISDYDSDEEDQFMNEIMSQSQQDEGRLMEYVKQLIGNKNSQTNCSAIRELTSAHRLIVERDHLLKNLEHKFQEKLYLVEENIQHTRERITSIIVQSGSNIKTLSSTKIYFRAFGSPYFKDCYGFGPPHNADHVAKLKTDQFPVVFVEKPCFWTEDHQNKLLDAIKDTLAIEKTDTLIKRVNKFKSMLSDCQEKKRRKELQAKLNNCQKELDEIKEKSFTELISGEPQDREYDWMKYSASVFEGEHSSDECKRFWEVYLKTSINKSNWTVAEDLKMLDIAEQTELQDWDHIAKSLGTNRSAYQCFLHFQTRLNAFHVLSKGKWTKEEDEKLVNCINASKIGNFIPWTKVSCLMEGRTRTQIYNRYKNSLDPKLVKGRFTKGEDLLIAAGIEVFGCNYKELSTLFNNRSSNQLRDRYQRYILPNSVRIGSWSLEEDEQLMKLVDRYGEQNWSAISKEMKVRSRTQVRQRYRFIQKKMSTKSGCTIANLKRRSVHIRDKSLENTKRSVQKIKQEIDEVEQSFSLTKVEKDIFRMEKLKELRDKLLMMTYKLQCKNKMSIGDSQVNDCFREFFKHNQIKSPESNKICSQKEYKNYFNELIFLANIFGHELKMPDKEDDILNNPQLSNNLKNVLLKSNNIKTMHPSIQSTVNTLPPPDCFNIDYIPPESDTSIIMNEHWFMPSMKLSSLNFSEFLKPTIFDYSCGVHQDIWDSKMKRIAQINLNTIENNSNEPLSNVEQTFNMPPNLLTTLGFKSVLLSKARLKQDCKKMPKESVREDSECNFNINEEIDINNCLDGFQETLLTLFTWPEALSHCNSSELLNSRKHKYITDKETASRDGRKIKKGKNKKCDTYNSKWGELKASRVNCKRKMKIEHLLRAKKEKISSCPVKSTVIVTPIRKRLKKLKSNDENKSPVDGFGTKKKNRKQNKKTKENKRNKNKKHANKKFTRKNISKLILSKIMSGEDLSKSEETPNLSMSKTYSRKQKRKAESGCIYIPTKKINIVSPQKIMQSVCEVENCLQIIE